MNCEDPLLSVAQMSEPNEGRSSSSLEEEGLRGGRG